MRGQPVLETSLNEEQWQELGHSAQTETFWVLASAFLLLHKVRARGSGTWAGSLNK